jgi:hypothetical protein
VRCAGERDELDVAAVGGDRDRGVGRPEVDADERHDATLPDHVALYELVPEA